MTKRIVEVTGSFAGTGAGASAQVQGMFNVLVTGVGTVQLERSFDAGSTFVACNRDSAGTLASWAVSAGAPLNVSVIEPEAGVLYRLNCTAFTSTLAWRISQ